MTCLNNFKNAIVIGMANLIDITSYKHAQSLSVSLKTTVSYNIHGTQQQRNNPKNIFIYF
jgi:hypothetical protein